MPADNQRPSEDGAWRSLARRLERLERKTKSPERSKQEEIVPFSYSGAITLTPAGERPRWNVRTGGQVVSASLHLDTAGSSSTVMTFYLNSTTMGTITLASSDTDEEAYLGDYRAKPGDKISARITTAGTGAKGLSAFVILKG